MLKVQILPSQELNLGQVCPEIHTSIPQENGGAERDRTVDPLLAKQVLSQLSYSPVPQPL